jgi:hypothetical protein
MIRKTRKAHLWIGLIASLFIFVEAITGLIMNEPWLIGQHQVSLEKGQGFQERGNFDNGQFNQGGNDQFPSVGNDQMQSQFQFKGNGEFQGRLERGHFGNQNSFMGVIKGLHEGRIGGVNIKWLMDLAALAMIFLTGSGIYLSIKILRAEKKQNGVSQE